LYVALVTLILALGFLSPGGAEEPSTFEQMVSSYETIRLALLHDHLDDVSESAGKIRALAARLEDGPTSEAAGIRPAGVEELRELLPSVREAAARMEEAQGIAGVRDSFGALSKALVRYRRLVEGPAPAVAFCSMAQQVWLQPSGEIGNPYYGQSMARCGEFVSQ
jgi:hypothetical protein